VAEGVHALLMALTATPGDSSAQVYARWAGLTITGESLEQLVRHRLAVTGKAAQVRESLLATVRAGGGIGESVEQCLLRTGLTGWS
jgi:hypothetical protein